MHVDRLVPVATIGKYDVTCLLVRQSSSNLQKLIKEYVILAAAFFTMQS